MLAELLTNAPHHSGNDPVDPCASPLTSQQCVALNPSWAKGYSRLGAAYFGLQEYQEAIKAYEQGLEKDASNEQLQSGLAEAKAAAREELRRK